MFANFDLIIELKDSLLIVMKLEHYNY